MNKDVTARFIINLITSLGLGILNKQHSRSFLSVPTESHISPQEFCKCLSCLNDLNYFYAIINEIDKHLNERIGHKFGVVELKFRHASSKEITFDINNCRVSIGNLLYASTSEMKLVLRMMEYAKTI